MGVPATSTRVWDRLETSLLHFGHLTVGCQRKWDTQWSRRIREVGGGENSLNGITPKQFLDSIAVLY